MKFESKVGSRRTTKIGNLVVLDIFLVALILIIPHNMRFVLSSQNGISLLEKERICMDNYFPKKIQKISGSQEDNQISNVGCPH